MSVRRELVLQAKTKSWALHTQQYAPVMGYLLTPVSLVGYVLSFWRLGADLKWVSDFFIESGLFSRWQVWLAVAIATQIAANQIKQLGKRDDTVTP